MLIYFRISIILQKKLRSKYIFSKTLANAIFVLVLFDFHRIWLKAGKKYTFARVPKRIIFFFSIALAIAIAVSINGKHRAITSKRERAIAISLTLLFAIKIVGRAIT